jgi:hypothetical protein
MGKAGGLLRGESRGLQHREFEETLAQPQSLKDALFIKLERLNVARSADKATLLRADRTTHNVGFLGECGPKQGDGTTSYIVENSEAFRICLTSQWQDSCRQALASEPASQTMDSFVLMTAGQPRNIFGDSRMI